MAPPARTDVHQHLWALEVKRLAPEDATPLLRAWGRVAAGLGAHPRLRVVFAALAGLAPLHGERAAVRRGPAVPSSPQLFYDTSSYGAQAIAAVAAVVGAGQLVHGSDFPVLAADAPADDARVRENPARLLG
jgi:6-methylsalicylate decarboxylase